MKRKLFLVLVFVAATTFANATVRTLNNNNPSPGQFTTWASVDAVSAHNDTVYVSGSPMNYGNITVTKILTIIGTGHNPQKQNPLVSTFGEITVDTLVGSIRLNGVEATRVILYPFLGPATIYADNCKLARIILGPRNGYDAIAYLHNNIITGEISGGYNVLTASNSSGLTGEISNNICYGSMDLRQNLEDIRIFNNLFIRSNINGIRLFQSGTTLLVNSVFNNNIFINIYPNSYFSSNSNVTNISYENNMYYGSSAPPTGWINTIISNPLFVNFPCANNNGADCPYDPTKDYHLSNTSPGHNAGTDGTDIGPYGGPYGASFTTYGEPNIPQIKQMNMPSSVVSGSTFNVNVISTVK